MLLVFLRRKNKLELTMLNLRLIFTDQFHTHTHPYLVTHHNKGTECKLIIKLSSPYNLPEHNLQRLDLLKINKYLLQFSNQLKNHWKFSGTIFLFLPSFKLPGSVYPWTQ
ncbi:unnamed protein product [Heterobilharzia americana]|nr:unnamed protein product [Heterobilharzia americana]CAH8535383.1 unnamed protein product [Heterobilharzia americana]